MRKCLEEMEQSMDQCDKNEVNVDVHINFKQELTNVLQTPLANGRFHLPVVHENQPEEECEGGMIVVTTELSEIPIDNFNQSNNKHIDILKLIGQNAVQTKNFNSSNEPGVFLEGHFAGCDDDY